MVVEEKLGDVGLLLDTYIQQRMHEENIPSVVVALVDRSGTIHVTTHGFADVAARTPATRQTLYETGSIGKSYTSAVLLQLEDEGKIDLQAPVTDYLPWFEVQSAFEPIRVHHLMSHSAGIIRGTDFAPDPRFEVWALRDSRTSHAPGEHFHYSNVGYKALGLILERIEGKPYAEIVRERILDPLGMQNTFGTVTHEIRPKMAVGYQRLYDDRPGHRDDPLVPAPWFQTNTADGCLASSVDDLATYLRLYLNGGTLNGTTIVTPENFSRMAGKQIATDRNDTSSWYGFGLMSGELDGDAVLGHGGGMVGYFSDMICMPEHGVGAVAMVNGIGRPSEFTHYALRLLRAALTGDDLPPVPDPVDPSRVENAGEFAGVYTGEPGTVEVAAEGTSLYLVHGTTRIALEQRGPDQFYVPHPELRRALLEFGRDDSGAVVEAFHGDRWYRSDRYSGPTTFEGESELAALAGEYRSHNPWQPHLRIIHRKGRLISARHNLAFDRLEDGSFGEPESAERLTFDTFIDGQAQRANYSGNDFYRFFTGDQ